MKILIIVLAIVIIWCIVYANRKKLENFVDNNFEYELTLGSINKMSYSELDKMHNDLLPLCNEIVYSDIAFSMNKEDRKLQYKDKRNEELSNNKRIYGCKTYGDAFELNAIIVKRLDELDKINGE